MYDARERILSVGVGVGVGMIGSRCAVPWLGSSSDKANRGPNTKVKNESSFDIGSLSET